MADSLFKRQVLPLILTFVVFVVLVGALWLEIFGLNQITTTDILLRIRWVDVLVGLTIYLKTSIDFAIFIGRLMEKNSDWKSRIAIEVGTALGNALGTMAILLVWTFFKEVRWLLAAMVFLAALVLFKLAEDSLEHVTDDGIGFSGVKKAARLLEKVLGKLNALVAPVLKFILPNMKATKEGSLRFWPLFLTSFTIPFILGMDDFAGYVPLFSIVNVFGFGTGVFLGHMVLNLFLYLSPERTIKAVKNSLISFIGSLAFIGLGIWGLIEVVKIIEH